MLELVSSSLSSADAEVSFAGSVPATSAPSICAKHSLNRTPPFPPQWPMGGRNGSGAVTSMSTTGDSWLDPATFPGHCLLNGDVCIFLLNSTYVYPDVGALSKRRPSFVLCRNPCSSTLNFILNRGANELISIAEMPCRGYSTLYDIYNFLHFRIATYLFIFFIVTPRYHVCKCTYGSKLSSKCIIFVKYTQHYKYA